jgi:hypothetical protein
MPEITGSSDKDVQNIAKHAKEGVGSKSIFDEVLADYKKLKTSEEQSHFVKGIQTAGVMDDVIAGQLRQLSSDNHNLKIINQKPAEESLPVLNLTDFAKPKSVPDALQQAIKENLSNKFGEICHQVVQGTNWLGDKYYESSNFKDGKEVGINEQGGIHQEYITNKDATKFADGVDSARLGAKEYAEGQRNRGESAKSLLFGEHGVYEQLKNSKGDLTKGMLEKYVAGFEEAHGVPATPDYKAPVAGHSNYDEAIYANAKRLLSPCENNGVATNETILKDGKPVMKTPWDTLDGVRDTYSVNSGRTRRQVVTDCISTASIEAGTGKTVDVLKGEAAAAAKPLEPAKAEATKLADPTAAEAQKAVVPVVPAEVPSAVIKVAPADEPKAVPTAGHADPEMNKRISKEQAKLDALVKVEQTATLKNGETLFDLATKILEERAKLTGEATDRNDVYREVNRIMLASGLHGANFKDKHGQPVKHITDRDLPQALNDHPHTLKLYSTEDIATMHEKLIVNEQAKRVEALKHQAAAWQNQPLWRGN